MNVQLPAAVSAAMKRYVAFRPEERLAAEIARLRATLHEISRIATQGGVEVPGQVASLSAWVPDIDLEEDIAFMAAERQKRGEELPDF